MNEKNLVKRFKDAGLVLKILKDPIRKGRGMDRIVQMDIQSTSKKNNRRDEVIRMYLGHPDNHVEVRNIDNSCHQLVLMVKEPSVEFDDEIAYGWSSTFKVRTEREIKENKQVVRYRNDTGSRKFIVTMKTPAEVRYFLLGVDERQLFISQLSKAATTVAEARKLLGNTVQFSDGKRKGSSADRQGEWFFLEVSSDLNDTIDRELKTSNGILHRKVNIGQFFNRPGGNPHIVDELAILKEDTEDKGRHAAGSRRATTFRRKIYVRGKVRHIDHKTVKFSNWREVVANNETVTPTGPGGVFWID